MDTSDSVLRMTKGDLRSCAPCCAGVNEFEDVVVSKLICWLERVTCIRWLLPYQNARKPSHEDAQDDKPQYGIVEFQSSNMYPLKSKEVLDHNGNDGCVVFEGQVEASIKLSVYGVTGDSCIDQPYGSAIDVIMRVRDKYHVTRFSDLLNCEQMQITDFGLIQNIWSETNGLYEKRAFQAITLCYKRRTSVAEDVYENVAIDVNRCCEALDKSKFQKIVSSEE